MLKMPKGAPGRRRSLQTLLELVDALDRRVPQPLAAREEEIAADSAHLRAWASTSIRALRRESLERDRAELGAAQAAMTDDGAPSRCGPECETTA